MSPRKGYYRLLGVPRDADRLTIRRTYQRLARQLHPSLHPGDREAEGRFQAILHAYRVLSDPDRRQSYDQGESAGPEPGAAPIRRRPSLAPRRLAGQLEELVAELVISREPESTAAADLDIESEVALEFAEAIRGVTTSLSLQLEVPCAECDGQGRRAGGACTDCGGRGVLVELDRIRVRFPPGVEHGSRLRVRGNGNPAVDGGERGDLHITLRVRSHSYFRRRSFDIWAELPLTVAEATLGAEVEVPTIDGPVRVKIPPGTDSGQVFRLRERGVTGPEGRRGHHYYTVQIAVPRDPSGDSRRLLHRLEQPNPRRSLPREAL